MFEKAEQKLIPFGRAHPRLQWLIIGLLMLAWCLDGAWASAEQAGRGVVKAIRHIGDKLRAELLQYKRHAPRRAMAVALALGMSPYLPSWQIRRATTNTARTAITRR